MMDALVNLKRFVEGDAGVELFPLRERTRWSNRTEQKFSLHAEINGVFYCYRLVIGTAGDPIKPVVQSETLDCDTGRFRLTREHGEVTYGRPDFSPTSPELPGGRSAISNLPEEDFTALAIKFRDWLNTVCVVRSNPLKMESLAEREDAEPKLDLSNFAAWYRSLLRSHPQKRADALFESLRETLDGFDSIVLEDAGQGMTMLNVVFQREGESPVSFRLEELSDGQRSLICLYTITHFAMADRRTVIIDEPESFVSLREIQPWLMTASELATDSHAQLILISHHPELIDQWAPRHGIRFLRDGAGPVYVKRWTGVPESSLSAAELVARGWEDD
jgi:hypothetical protein